MFLACSTQWRQTGVGLGGLIVTGLDYAALDAVMRRRGAPDAVFDDVRVMEEAALPILNERHK